jgi:DNA-binding CsgD family transcriptional regulator
VLDGIGVDAEHEQVYRFLLASPEAALPDLEARWPDRPVRRTRKILRRLTEHGLVIESKTGSGSLFTAVAPDLVIPGLARLRAEEARRAEQAVPALMDAFWQGHRNDAHQFVDVVDDPTEIVERWQQMQRAACTEVRALDCPPYFGDPVEPDPVELERLRDGVSYRVIYAEEVLRAPGRWADIEAGIAAGEQAKLVPELPAKLTLFDDFAATLPFNIDNDRPTAAAIVHRSPLLTCLGALFEMYWAMAVPLVVNASGEPAPALGEVSPADTRLVRLLAAGLGDDAIRRTLGISASTVHRRVHDLMTRLGATTRFQAGLQIGRTGAPFLTRANGPAAADRAAVLPSVPAQVSAADDLPA